MIFFENVSGISTKKLICKVSQFLRLNNAQMIGEMTLKKLNPILE